MENPLFVIAVSGLLIDLERLLLEIMRYSKKQPYSNN